MRWIRIAPLLLAAVAIGVAGCNGSSEEDASPTASGDADVASEVSVSPTSEGTQVADESLADAVSPTAAPEATMAAEDCEPTTNGEASGGTTPVTVNNECLDPLFFAFKQNGNDPFWHIHTQQANTFISLELYIAYGPSWTGETGTFPLDCNQPWGLCLIFDPDGAGPAPVVMWGTGEITIDRLDEDGYDVTFSGVMPPAADGTVYDFQSTNWTGS